MPVATKKKKRATAKMTPNPELPASPNGDGHPPRDTLGTYAVEDGGGHLVPDAPEVGAALVPHIRELVVQRNLTIKMQRRLNNQCRALTRRVLGWKCPPLQEEEDKEAAKERERINKEAEKMVVAIQKGCSFSDTQSTSARIVTPFILMSLEARKPFDTFRKNIEKAMRKAAVELPVWERVKDIHGFGELGLAIIVGECGDLSGYANPGKVWKRLGLAPPDTYIKVCKNGEPAKLIPKQRRSAVWTIGDSMIKAGGEYKALYDERKQYEHDRDPEMTTMKAHRRAQRYMEKRLIRELWKAWRPLQA